MLQNAVAMRLSVTLPTYQTSFQWPQTMLARVIFYVLNSQLKTEKTSDTSSHMVLWALLTLKRPSLKSRRLATTGAKIGAIAGKGSQKIILNECWKRARYVCVPLACFLYCLYHCCKLICLSMAFQSFRQASMDRKPEAALSCPRIWKFSCFRISWAGFQLEPTASFEKNMKFCCNSGFKHITHWKLSVSFLEALTRLTVRRCKQSGLQLPSQGNPVCCSTQ